MVGGLVEQEHIGIGGEGGGNGQPFSPPARQLPHRLFGRSEAELVEGDGDPNLAFGLVLRFAGIEGRAARRHLHDRRGRIEVVILLDRGHPQTASAVNLTRVGIDGAGENPEQRGLARTVGSDDADPVALGQSQAQPVEQSSRPECVGELASSDERRHTAESIRAAGKDATPDRQHQAGSLSSNPEGRQ